MRLVSTLLLCCITLASCTKQEPRQQGQPEKEGLKLESRRLELRSAVPDKAIEVYDRVLSTGFPPQGYVGGRVFENREHRLPPGGNYREYDVNPKIPGQNRGPERLIIEQTSGHAWYTPDHYNTFIPIERKSHDKQSP